MITPTLPALLALSPFDHAPAWESAYEVLYTASDQSAYDAARNPFDTAKE